MHLSREDWAVALKLLDAALELPAPDRSVWLDALSPEHARIRPFLLKLLQDRHAIETDDFLQSVRALPADDDCGFSVGQAIGPYRLLRRLGEGGMASVWLAERADGAHRREVALKLPHLDRGGARIIGERFLRERTILSNLSHPGIASVLDAGSDGGQPWLGMEFVDGQPITDHAKDRRLPLAARLRLMLQVLRAVQHAHEQLVIHRDIKPSNVLVDARGDVKLLDFGVAKLLEPDGATVETDLTQRGGRAMTPRYASPEQVAGGTLGTASDVYSLGVLLFELLTGRLPYRPARGSAAAMEEAIIEARIERPSAAVAERALARALRGDVDTIVLKALQESPGQRYGSAAAFAQDIEACLDSRPIQARPDALAYRLRKLLVRQRWAFGAGAALFTALAGGLGTTLWQAEAARREASRAAAARDFLVGMFEVNSLDQDDALRKRQQSVQELLQSRAGQLDQELAQQPRLLADLQGVAGRLLNDLALPAQALALRERRSALLATTGAGPVEQAQALADVAETLLQTDRRERAADVLRQGLNILGGRSDAGVDLARARLTGSQGQLLMAGGKVAESVEPIEASEQLVRRVAPGSREHAEALMRLGSLRGAQNRLQDSLSAYRESIDIQRVLLGPESASFAKARFRLGDELQAQRRMVEADAEMVAALDIMRRAAGPEHVLTALIESSLGRLRSTRGKPGQGRDLVVHAAAVLQAHDAEVSPSRVIEALMTLGDSYVTSGQLEAAVEPLEDGMARLRQHPEVETPEGVPEMLYTRFLIDRGEFAKAVELLQRVRARAAAAFGADDPYVSDIELRIGVVHIHTGRLEEAESVFLKIMHDADLREDDFGSPKHQAQLNLAAVRMEQRRFEEAAPAILAMYRKMSAQPPLERNVRLEIVTNVRMGQLLTGLGRAAEARQHFERALALAADLDPASPLVAQTRGRFALCLIDLHDRPAAETQLRLAERAFAAQPVVSGFFKRPMVEARRRLADSGGRWPPMGHS